MGRFVAGDLVVVPFPFSSEPGEKRRPAIILAHWECVGSTDYLMCMVTSQNVSEPTILPLRTDDVREGVLNRDSYVRPLYLFTISEYRVIRRIGKISPALREQILDKIKIVLFPDIDVSPQ